MTGFTSVPEKRELRTLQVAVFAALLAGLIGVIFGFYLGYRLAQEPAEGAPAPKSLDESALHSLAHR
ncbi:MAG: hypothetical protein ACFBZ8_07925 [Opitutales bacterium]